MLGICVVYHIPSPAVSHLLDVSIARIRATTRGAYRLYGAAAFHSAPDTVDRLRAAGVELPPIEPLEGGGPREHAHLLDRLFDHAVQEGCTHVVSFDMDSWPVVGGWDIQSRAQVSETVPVVAAMRSEVAANFPFPGFTLIDARFWQPGHSSFALDQRRRFDPALAAQVSRPGESGAGILAQLLEEDKGWIRLTRSNAWDPHGVMCGLYGDRVFHLGGASRQAVFWSDEAEFGIGDSVLRGEYRLAVNAARRAFFLGLLPQRETELVDELRAASSARPAPGGGQTGAASSPIDLEHHQWLEREYKAARQQAEQAQAQFEHLQRATEGLIRRIDQLEALAERRARVAERRKRRIAAMESSLSWKLSLPIRWVGRWLGPKRSHGPQ